MSRKWKLAVRCLALVLLAAAWSAGCNQSGKNRPPACGELVTEWGGGPLPGYTPLSVAEIQTIIGQAVEQSTAQAAAAVGAVVDREGFGLGLYAMTGAPLGR